MDTSPASQLDQEHLNKVLDARPEAATDLGVVEGGERWGASGLQADAALAGLIQTWTEARAAVDTREMSARDVTQLSMDQTALEGSLRMLQLTVDRGEVAYVDPDVVTPRVRLLIRQAFQLANTQERVEALAARLNGLGASLKAAQQTVPKADAHLLQRARTQLAPCRNALGDLLPIVLRRLEDRSKAQGALNPAVAAAQAALDDHANWLEAVQPHEGLAALGEEATEAFFSARRWEMSADDVEDVCQSHIEDMRIERRRLRRRAFKRLSVAEALSTSRSQAPYSAEEAASWLQELAEQARQFCLETAIFPLTDDAVVVEDAPTSLHALLGGVSFLPPTRDPSGPPMVLLADATGGEVVSDLSVADLEAICARWLFPGACLHASLGVREHSAVRQGVPLGIAPAMASSYGSDLTLGWRLHAQELMRELQFRESPAARLVLCDRSLLDGLLGWYDVRLCRGAISVDDAVRGLVQHADLNETEARHCTWELLRAPGAAASAVIGKARLKQLRRSARIKWRHGYAERRFHDLALGAGALPVAVLFGLLDEFSPFSADEGTVEYELDEVPDGEGLGGPLPDPETAIIESNSEPPAPAAPDAETDPPAEG